MSSSSGAHLHCQRKASSSCSHQERVITQPAPGTGCSQCAKHTAQQATYSIHPLHASHVVSVIEPILQKTTGPEFTCRLFSMKPHAFQLLFLGCLLCAKQYFTPHPISSSSEFFSLSSSFRGLPLGSAHKAISQKMLPIQMQQKVLSNHVLWKHWHHFPLLPL